MTNRPLRSGLVLAAFLLSLASVASAQETTIKKVPVKPSNPTSGAGMFKEYCAVCHGADAKGDGPAASALKVPPPDLTTLAKRHDGTFPDAHVANVLRNGVKAPAHGTSEMPIWGPLFSSMNQGDNAQITLRISNLTKYLKSLQVK